MNPPLPEFNRLQEFVKSSGTFFDATAKSIAYAAVRSGGILSGYIKKYPLSLKMLSIQDFVYIP